MINQWLIVTCPLDLHLKLLNLSVPINGLRYSITSCKLRVFANIYLVCLGDVFI